jgi:hypothetical protein
MKQEAEKADSSEMIRTKMKRIKKFKTQREKVSPAELIDKPSSLKGGSWIV